MPNQDDFLKTAKILRLATIDNTGMPHIVPVWYLYRTKKYYVGTNTRTRKVKNIQKNNRVSFCIDVGINSPDIYGVMGKGIAKIILDKNKIKKIATDIILRYFSTIENDSAQELLRDTDCIIEIIPQEIVTWRY